MENTQSLLGKGLYSLPEAARLLGVPTTTLRRWVDGYTFWHEGEQRVGEPVVARELPALADERLLTFGDLIELKFVSLFRQEGVSLATIRAASQAAIQQYHVTHPFAMKRFQTDGTRIFATLEAQSVEGVSPERLLLELARGQMVIEDVARPFFRTVEYERDKAMRLRPLGPESRVVLDPHRAFGKPIDEKSGVPTYVLYQMVRGGESKARVAWWHNVDEEAVSEAIAFESGLQKAA